MALKKISSTKYVDESALPGQIYELSIVADTITATRLAMTGTAATQTQTFTQSTDGKFDDIAARLGAISTLLT